MLEQFSGHDQGIAQLKTNRPDNGISNHLSSALDELTAAEAKIEILLQNLRGSQPSATAPANRTGPTCIRDAAQDVRTRAAHLNVLLSELDVLF